MKVFKWGAATVALSALLLAGCGEDATQPPKNELLTTNHKEKGIIGEYCWEHDGKENCEDSEDIQKVLEKAEEVPVTMETAMSFAVDSDDRPVEATLSWVTKDGDKGEKDLKSSLVIAPKQKGVYYYTYTAKWDGSGENGYKGEAEYFYKVRIQ